MSTGLEGYASRQDGRGNPSQGASPTYRVYAYRLSQDNNPKNQRLAVSHAPV